MRTGQNILLINRVTAICHCNAPKNLSNVSSYLRQLPLKPLPPTELPPTASQTTQNATDLAMGKKRRVILDVSGVQKEVLVADTTYQSSRVHLIYN